MSVDVIGVNEREKQKKNTKIIYYNFFAYSTIL